MEITQLVQEIQYVLTPAVMVSSTALLLLGLQTKFSNLANRFRTLHHERRTLSLKATRDAAEEDRLRNVQEQVDHLMRRAACVKTAVLLAYSGIVCFMVSSILIFCTLSAPFPLGYGVIAAFMLGLACVLVSALVMLIETRLFHKVLTLERLS